MAGTMDNRLEIARGYKIRSDRSILTAQHDLTIKDNHGSINRSWYSVMQLVTAATWIVLTHKKPPANQLNWNHKLQASLFEEVAARKTGTPRELFSKYSREIEVLYERREDADYRVDRDIYVTDESAQYCLESAKKLREKINELMGDWPC